MKTSILIPVLWFASLVGAFIVGYQTTPPGGQVGTGRQSPGLDAPAPSIMETQKGGPLPERMEGPVKLSLEDLLFCENTADQLYQFEKMVEALDAESLPLFLSELEALPHTKRRDQWILQVVSRWGELDPETAAGYIETYPGNLRVEFIRAMSTGWAKLDPANAWEYYLVQTSGGATGQSSGIRILSEVAKSDPAMALNLITKIEDRRAKDQYYNQFWRIAGIHGNFGEVAAAMALIPDPTIRQMGMNGLWKEWASYDLEGVMASYHAMPGSPEKSNALKQIMAGWASQDPSKALAYCTQQIPEEERGPALKEVVKVWAESGRIKEAAEFILTLPVDRDSDDAVNAIAFQMARENPQAALSWVNSLQNEERVKAGQNMVIGHWADRNYPAAKAFVMTKPPGKDRDDNLISLLTSQVGFDKVPDETYLLIESMDDPRRREEMVEALVKMANRDLPSHYGMPNTIDRKQMAERIRVLQGISEETRDKAISLLTGGPSG